MLSDVGSGHTEAGLHIEREARAHPSVTFFQPATEGDERRCRCASPETYMTKHPLVRMAAVSPCWQTGLATGNCTIGIIRPQTCCVREIDLVKSRDTQP